MVKAIVCCFLEHNFPKRGGLSSFRSRQLTNQIARFLPIQFTFHGPLQMIFRFLCFKDSILKENVYGNVLILS